MAHSRRRRDVRRRAFFATTLEESGAVNSPGTQDGEALHERRSDVVGRRTAREHVQGSAQKHK